jgi:hypothetical protein
MKKVQIVYENILATARPFHVVLGEARMNAIRLFVTSKRYPSLTAAFVPRCTIPNSRVDMVTKPAPA